MLKNSKTPLAFLMVLLFFLLSVGSSGWATEREDRVRALQERLKALKEQLSVMQEAELREQPPTESPWQPILKAGEERIAYAHYVYLLGSQFSQENLDDILQQIYYIASQDPLEKKSALFVIPATSLAPGETMSVDAYNRGLSIDFLNRVGIPSAIEGGLLVSEKPLHKLEQGDDRQLLFIDLTGSDQILRARMFELLLNGSVFGPEGHPQNYIWELLRKATPQAFSMYWQNDMIWLSAESR